MFKIDSIKLRLKGNYIECLNTSVLECLNVSNTQIKGRLSNLEIRCNSFAVYVAGSVSTFMHKPINQSNFSSFIECLNLQLNIKEFQFSDVLRLDVCTDIETKENINVLSSNLTHLNHFKRFKHEHTLYFQTSLHKHKGTKIVLYQKSLGIIRFELRTFKNSKYDIRKASNIEKHFLNLCEASVEYYSKIKKSNNMKLSSATNQLEAFGLFVREVYNLKGIDRVNELLSLIDAPSHGYKYKKKILGILSDGSNRDDLSNVLSEALSNTKKY